MAVRAIRAGTVAIDWWRAAFAAVAADARAPQRGGPVAEVLRSLRALGLGDDFENWAPSPAAPGGWQPLSHPRSETLRVVKAAWAAAEWRAVAARRQDMAHLADGIDRH
eukprot:4648872-Lingulodinium_polyedra.AAC.1